ncbi:MAG: copper resistance protein B [Candidatus Sericytochromatia bacterium]
MIGAMRHLLIAALLWSLAPAMAKAQAPHPTHDPPGPEPTQPNVIPQPGWPKPVMDQALYRMVLFELLEVAPASGGIEWDMAGWYGGDYDRLWIKSEGALGPAFQGGDVEVQALYGRLVAPFYDFQIGLRMDRSWDEGPQASRLLGAIGLQGLAPYWFEVEPVLFVSPQGQLSARLTASRELLLTQRTILEGRFETNAAWQRAEAFGVGAGLNDLSLGLRLRHELRRELAPYVGLTWERRFGETAALAAARGELAGGFSLVAGARIWY